MPQQIQPSSAPQATDNSNFGGPNAAQMAAAAAATKQQPVAQVGAPQSLAQIQQNQGYTVSPAATPGMPGYNPAGNQPIQKPVAPPSEPTVLSSGNINDTVIPNNTTTLTQLSNKGQYSQDGVVYNSDGTLAPASIANPNAPQQGQIPQGGTDNGNGTYTLNGLTYTNAPDPQTETINANIQHLQSTLDASTKASIDAISKQYAQLKDAQTSINTSAAGARQAALLTGGTSRYSPDTASGIMQTQLSFGLQQIAKLDSDENTAIAQAQAAQQNGEAQLADKLISDANDLRTQKQTIANQLNDALSKANAAQLATQQQSNMDSAIATQFSQGITDPAAIIRALAAQGMTVTAKDIADTMSNLNPNAAAVASIMTDAAKNGATPDVLKAIGASTTVAGAIAAAGDTMIDPTSSAGQYATYVKQAKAAGQTPVSYQAWNDKVTASQAYSKAYASAAGSAAAAVNTTESDPVQQKLEQQGRAVIEKELSNRSGGLGLQDAKVNQAIHLKALLDQYATTETVPAETNLYGEPIGNKTTTKTVYNVPASQYTELAMGLASLISPANTVAEGTINNIMTSTAKGDLNAALTYATGSPQNGTTQGVLQNIKDSIDRQGTVAEQERQTYIDNLDALLPTDLDADRRAALLSGSQLNSYTNPTQGTNGVNNKIIQSEQQAETALSTFYTSSAQNKTLIDAIHAQFPDMSAQEVAQKLNIQ